MTKFEHNENFIRIVIVRIVKNRNGEKWLHDITRPGSTNEEVFSIPTIKRVPLLLIFLLLKKTFFPDVL